MKYRNLIILTIATFLLQGCKYTPSQRYLTYSPKERQELESMGLKFYHNYVVEDKNKADNYPIKSATLGDRMYVATFREGNVYKHIRVLRTDDERKYYAHAFETPDNNYRKMEFGLCLHAIENIKRHNQQEQMSDTELMLQSNISFQNEVYRLCVKYLKENDKSMSIKKIFTGSRDYPLSQYRCFTADGTWVDRPKKSPTMPRELISRKPSTDSSIITIPVAREDDLYRTTQEGFFPVVGSWIGVVYECLSRVSLWGWKWWIGLLFVIAASVLGVVVLMNGAETIANTSLIPTGVFITLGVVMALYGLAPWYSLGIGKYIISILLIASTILVVVSLLGTDSPRWALLTLIANAMAMVGSLVLATSIAGAFSSIVGFLIVVFALAIFL